MKPLASKQGSVLLACVIITVLIMAVIVKFTNWVSQTTRNNVSHVASHKAMINADSGIQAALQYLRSPEAASLIPGTPKLLTTVTSGTTFYLEMTRQITNTSLVDVHSTGYYHLQQGSAVDSAGRNAQLAAVYAQIQLRNVGDYFAASPGTLEISYGSNLSSGVVYGKDLIFQAGTTLPQTTVKAASYFNSISPVNYNSYVTFIDAGQPVQLGTEPTLPVLDIGLRNKYQGMAGTDVLPGGTVLSGTLDSPGGNPYKVFFSAGDITLGTAGSSCTLNSSFLVYAQGNIYIANTVDKVLDTTAWPALLAEGNIYITDTAPDHLEISATMVTNGQVKALGSPRPNGTLKVTGGIVTGAGISLGSVYTQERVYTFQAPDPTLALPFATQVILYKVTAGKYR